jgi:hypothetical protein
MDDYTLGQRVTVTHRLERKTSFAGSTDDYKFNKTWVEMPLPEPVEGIIIGVRHLSNGKTAYDYDAGMQYERESGLVGVLIAHDLRRSPFYVLPERLPTDD